MLRRWLQQRGSALSKNRLARRYAIALLLTVVAAYARFLLQPVLQRAQPFVTFYLATYVTAWSAGFVPALVTAIVGGVIANFAFMAASRTAVSRITADVNYCVIALTGMLLIVSQRNARRQAARQARLAAARLREAEEQLAARARAEQELRRTRDQLAAAQRIAHLGSWESDLLTGQLWWSEETYRIFGVPSGQAVSREFFFSCIHSEDNEIVAAASRRAQMDAKPYSIEHRIVRGDGVERHVREQAEVLLDDAGRVARMNGTVQDITEYKALEAQLIQAQKMEAIGQLAGGVAHDFNNLLTVINGYAQLLLETVATNDVRREIIAEVMRAGARASALTKQLLTFSRRQVLAPQVLRINTAVAGIETMLRRLIGEDVRLLVTLDPNAGSVKIDPGQLEQVIVNLAVNARDAMPLGGSLGIATGEAYGAGIEGLPAEGVTPGRYVTLAVKDTGTGMDQQTQSRIFEPFFTTKPRGHGTGLGLATVYGIIKQCGGHISVSSEVGRGTTFTVYLPQIENEDETLTAEPLPSSSLHGTETILVVEDDDAVRDIVERVLVQHGYRVFAVAGAREAVELCSNANPRIDLLLSDVVMPEVAGPQLAQRLITLQPQIRVVYMSGYTETAIADRRAIEPGLTLIDKPFTPEGLARRVREILDRAGDAETEEHAGG